MLSELWSLKSQSSIMSNIKGEGSHICDAKSFILCESDEEAVRSLNAFEEKYISLMPH